MAEEIPTYDEFMLPVLKFLKDKKEHKTKEIYEATCNHFGFSDKQKRKSLPSGKSITYNNCQWAIFHLKIAKFVESIKGKKGYWQITKEGLDIIAKYKNQLTIKDLYENSVAYSGYRKKGKTKTEHIEKDFDIKESPEEILDAEYQKIRDKLVDDLLERIRGISPELFEKLVVDLLTKMGYGIGEVTGQTGDKGIDGIIKEDKLGLDEIYIQAKLWDENKKVSGPEIQKFVGALKGKHKGVFVTSSDFTPAAKDERADAQKSGKNIVFINGKELANLMIDYNLGVSLQQSYETKPLPRLKARGFPFVG